MAGPDGVGADGAVAVESEDGEPFPLLLELFFPPFPEPPLPLLEELSPFPLLELPILPPEPPFPLLEELSPLDELPILPPEPDRKSTRLNSSHTMQSRMPSSA